MALPLTPYSISPVMLLLSSVIILHHLAGTVTGIYLSHSPTLLFLSICSLLTGFHHVFNTKRQWILSKALTSARACFPSLEGKCVYVFVSQSWSVTL